MEYEGRGRNLKKSDVGCSLKKKESPKKEPPMLLEGLLGK
jgi:hypothetical protein